jgi:O-antigen ligase
MESPYKNTLWVLSDLSLLPLHPHNAFLQIWLELGLIGMLIASAFLYFLMEKGMSLVKRSQQMIFMSALFPSLVVVNMSYGLWQSWWICSLFIIAGIVQMMSRVLDKRV